MIVRDGDLGSNIDLGVDTGQQRHDWVQPTDPGRAARALRFPADQGWGAVTFLFSVDDPERPPVENLLGFHTLQVTLAGAADASVLGIDMRGTGSSPGDPRGTRFCVLPPFDFGQTFQTISIDLDELDPDAGDPVRARTFAPAQLVFGGDSAAEVWLRAITLYEERVEAASPCVGT
jgi:hypothetical protein